MEGAVNKVDDFLYEKESRLLIDCCKEVYEKFGGAFKEKIVENSLAVALENKGMTIERQKRIDVFFKDVKVGVYVIDLLIEDKIIVELKVKSFLTKDDEKQFWYYLKATNYKLGYLINFGPQRLEIKRRIFDKARSK